VQELGGSTARQTAELARGNIPYHGRHAQFVNGGWPGGRSLSALLVSMSMNPLLSWRLNFFGNFMKFVISGFHNIYLETDCESVIGC